MDWLISGRLELHRVVLDGTTRSTYLVAPWQWAAVGVRPGYQLVLTAIFVSLSTLDNSQCKMSTPTCPGPRRGPCAGECCVAGAARKCWTSRYHFLLFYFYLISSYIPLLPSFSLPLLFSFPLISYSKSISLHNLIFSSSFYLLVLLFIFLFLFSFTLRSSSKVALFKHFNSYSLILFFFPSCLQSSFLLLPYFLPLLLISSSLLISVEIFFQVAFFKHYNCIIKVLIYFESSRVFLVSRDASVFLDGLNSSVNFEMFRFFFLELHVVHKHRRSVQTVLCFVCLLVQK